MTNEDRAIILRRANENLRIDIQNHAAKYGWYNTAKVLREVVSVHVGWDENFTELDNVLRRMIKENCPPNTNIAPSSHLSQEPNIPNLPECGPNRPNK